MSTRRAFAVPFVVAALAAGSSLMLLQPQRPGGGGGGQPRQPGGPGGGGGGGQQPGGPGGPQGPGRGPGGPGGEGRQASVDQGMKQMNRVLRQLKSQIGDATKRDENLRLITEMQRGCVGAKGAALPPDFLKDAAGDGAKANAQWAFRAEMIALLRVLIDTEEAVGLGKADVAKAKLDAAIAIRDAGHKRYGLGEE